MPMFRNIFLNTRFQSILIRFFLLSTFLSTVVVYAENILNINGILLTDFVFLGGDYVSFFTASTIINEHPEQLYNFALQKDTRINNFPQLNDVLQNELFFIYPPLVASFLNLLSAKSYIDSFIIFSAVGFLLLTFSLFLLAREIKFFHSRDILFFLLLIVGFPAYLINCLIGGQMSWIATSIYALVYVCVRKNRYFFAGIIFALSYYKPPLFVISLIIFSCFFDRLFLVGFLTGGAFLLLLSLYLFDLQTLVDYLSKASTYTYAQEFAAGIKLPPDQGAGIVGLIFSLPLDVYTKVLLVLLSHIVIVFAFCRMGRNILFKDNVVDGLGYSFVIVCSCLLSLQFIRYDLTILLVPFILIINYIGTASSRLRYAILTIVGLFYFEALFRFKSVAGIVVNLSSFLLFILGVLLYTYITSNRPPASSGVK